MLPLSYTGTARVTATGSHSLTVVPAADDEGDASRHQHPDDGAPVGQLELPPQRGRAREGDRPARSLHGRVVRPTPSGKHRPVRDEGYSVARRHKGAQVLLVFDTLRGAREARAGGGGGGGRGGGARER